MSQILWDTEVYSDIRVIIGGKVYNLHREILIRTSDYFRALLEINKDIVETTLDITELDQELVLEFIKSFYDICEPNHINYFEYRNVYDYLLPLKWKYKQPSFIIIYNPGYTYYLCCNNKGWCKLKEYCMHSNPDYEDYFEHTVTYDGQIYPINNGNFKTLLNSLFGGIVKSLKFSKDGLQIILKSKDILHFDHIKSHTTTYDLGILWEYLYQSI